MVMKAGVDHARFFELARGSSANCWMVQDNNWYSFWKGKVDEPDTVYITHKDSVLAMDVAKELGLRLKHVEFIAGLDYLEVFRSVPLEAAISHFGGK